MALALGSYCNPQLSEAVSRNSSRQQQAAAGSARWYYSSGTGLGCWDSQPCSRKCQLLGQGCLGPLILKSGSALEFFQQPGPAISLLWLVTDFFLSSVFILTCFPVPDLAAIRTPGKQLVSFRTGGMAQVIRVQRPKFKPQYYPLQDKYPPKKIPKLVPFKFVPYRKIAYKTALGEVVKSPHGIFQVAFNGQSSVDKL
jgi:hypothetical protein